MARYTKLTGDERRSLIVTAAVDVANKEGLAEVTYEKVARRCAVQTSKHTVKHYFPLKSRLFERIIAHKNSNNQVKSMGKKLGY